MKEKAEKGKGERELPPDRCANGSPTINSLSFTAVARMLPPLRGNLSRSSLFNHGRTVASGRGMRDGTGVISVSRAMVFVLAVGGLMLCLGATGCALRATTDFGPGDEPAHRSVGAGAGPFHDLLSSDRRNLGGSDADASR